MKKIPTWTILGGGYQSYLCGNYDAAFSEWQPLARLGDVEAQYNLGVLYDQGAGVERDLSLAASWYRKAAENGFMDAQTNLGIMYLQGQGVERDVDSAEHWLRLAAAQGDGEASKYLEEIVDNRQATA